MKPRNRLEYNWTYPKDDLDGLYVLEVTIYTMEKKRWTRISGKNKQECMDRLYFTLIEGPDSPRACPRRKFVHDSITKELP